MNVSFIKLLLHFTTPASKQLVLNGIGYALLPSTVLKEVQENMYKTPVQLTRETWLLTSESARQLKQVQAFLEIIEEIQMEK